MKKIFFLACIFSLLAAAVPAGDEDNAVRPADLIGRRFVLETVNGNEFAGERRPFMEIRDELMLAGRMCNNFRGKATLADGVLTMPQAITTRMACLDEEISALERGFLAMMTEGASITLEGDVLTLKNNDFALAFRLEQPAEKPVSAEDLEGNTFHLIKVDGEAYAGERTPHIAFGPDLAVSGAICNSFRGPAQLKDGVLTIGPVAATMMLCPMDDLSTLEGRLFSQFTNGLRATWEDGNLVLRAEGAEWVFAKNTPEPKIAATDLVGKKFILKKVDGEEFSAREQPYVKFGEDMRVSGVACNNFSGNAELRDGVLHMENAVSTMKMCIDGKLNAYERGFHKLLREGARATLNDNSLTLSGGDSEFVYELADE